VLQALGKLDPGVLVPQRELLHLTAEREGRHWPIRRPGVSITPAIRRAARNSRPLGRPLSLGPALLSAADLAPARAVAKGAGDDREGAPH
jgi:hypothetical protein